MLRATSSAALLATLAFTMATGAAAQTMNANSANFNAGYGRSSGSENSPVDVQLTSAQGNLAVVNGLFQGAASGSVFNSSSGGAMDSATGAGASASAIGNSLNVVTNGDYNTVIVNSTQINTGAVTATSTTNGKR
ncbi:MAG: holdfast anchoring protein HfaA [Caulobacteraceae bacterium]|nr:holdfast anchoring protein HfaA [Caulobacteraceae bacterium]